MGHWCRICARTLPNERFSGKGHKNHICKKCSSLPKAEIDRVDQSEEIFQYLRQSNISKKNLTRLTELSESENLEISELAKTVLEVGKVKPHKKRRLKYLAQNHRDLLNKLKETNLIMAHHM
jgi:hypothetical protein